MVTSPFLASANDTDRALPCADAVRLVLRPAKSVVFALSRPEKLVLRPPGSAPMPVKLVLRPRSVVFALSMRLILRVPPSTIWPVKLVLRPWSTGAPVPVKLVLRPPKSPSLALCVRLCLRSPSSSVFTFARPPGFSEGASTEPASSGRVDARGVGPGVGRGDGDANMHLEGSSIARRFISVCLNSSSPPPHGEAFDFSLYCSSFKHVKVLIFSCAFTSSAFSRAASSFFRSLCSEEDLCVISKLSTEPRRLASSLSSSSSSSSTASHLDSSSSWTPMRVSTRFAA
mmetsp:Transcript_66104/g.121982  ORF Transcript_66104/g.121982 Transcript_66104/m.121982 type:complete len:286 (+) Transcript_66104:741-1598(+)